MKKVFFTLQISSSCYLHLQHCSILSNFSVMGQRKNSSIIKKQKNKHFTILIAPQALLKNIKLSMIYKMRYPVEWGFFCRPQFGFSKEANFQNLLRYKEFTRLFLFFSIIQVYKHNSPNNRRFQKIQSKSSKVNKVYNNKSVFSLGTFFQ